MRLPPLGCVPPWPPRTAPAQGSPPDADVHQTHQLAIYSRPVHPLLRHLKEHMTPNPGAAQMLLCL